MPDLVVTLVGPWSRLDDSRRSPLDDPMLDLRLAAELFRSEARVRMVDIRSERYAIALCHEDRGGASSPALTRRSTAVEPSLQRR